jgi:hypothetical protein
MVRPHGIPDAHEVGSQCYTRNVKEVNAKMGPKGRGAWAGMKSFELSVFDLERAQRIS